MAGETFSLPVTVVQGPKGPVGQRGPTGQPGPAPGGTGLVRVNGGFLVTPAGPLLSAEVPALSQSIAAAFTIAASSYYVVVRKFVLADGVKLSLGDGAILRFI